jgi:ATP-binding cassette subfamily B (MDR/TAP) protein 1
LLERFYDPKSGSIELDGINVKDINVRHLRSAIGYVGQEPTLFATSIRANIQYGNPQATFEQIQEAARLTNAHDFISAFPDGYDTQVGDKGSQLSGGQKQRIAIARVLVGKPRILVLDEATSALDSESELLVQEALDNILEIQKITTVIIAHRLSTIRGCDTINVLRNGVIVESGTHVDLMDKAGYYYELVMKQDGGVGSNADSAVDVQELSNEESSAIGKSSEKGKKTSLYPHVSFKDVIFSYPTRPKKIIFDGFSLDIELGSTVALVGPSGGGKSTTAGLIERFYDPQQGTVCYEGKDIKTLNLRWYRDQIGYVGQEPTLCKYFLCECGRILVNLLTFLFESQRYNCK